MGEGRGLLKGMGEMMGEGEHGRDSERDEGDIKLFKMFCLFFLWVKGIFQK